MQIGFRSRGGPAVDSKRAPPLPVEWTSEHNEAGFETRPEESLVLTGDEVLVEMTAEVQWRISNLRQYLFDSARPIETLRTLGRERGAGNGGPSAARRHLDRSPPTDRRRVSSHVSAVASSSTRLGIEVVELTLLDVHPPREVVAAYRDVADAIEEREQRVNEAEAYYAGKLLDGRGRTGRPSSERRSPRRAKAIRPIDDRRRLELDAD